MADAKHSGRKRKAGPAGAGAGPQPREQRKRGWCFTHQLPDVSVDALKGVGEAVARSLGACGTSVSCAILSAEKAPSTGQLHFQGYVKFAHPQTFEAVKRVFASLRDPADPEDPDCSMEGVHLEAQRGTDVQAWEYCEKGETHVAGPWIFGTKPSGQGSRTDLARFEADVKDTSVTRADLEEKHFGVQARHMRYYDRKVEARVLPRCERTRLYWLSGPAGTGKSFRARRAAAGFGFKPEQIYVWSPPTHKGVVEWFPGYRSQPCVIVNEWDRDCVSFSIFKQLCDETPYLVRDTGDRWVQFVATHFIVCSNHTLGELYPDQPEAQWRRRIAGLYTLDYHPDHRPDPSFSNDVETATHAVVTVEKGDPLP